MKKLFILFICAVTSFTMAAESRELSGADSKEVKLEETPLVPQQPTKERPRSATYFLKVFYDDQLNTAEIQHDNLGDADFYILDATGQVVSQTSTYSNTYTVESIDVPSANGTYTLVIDSENVYAFGYIVVE